MFVGEMSESRAKRIRIKEVDGWTLRILIDYIYTAEIQVTEENVQVRPRITSATEGMSSTESFNLSVWFSSGKGNVICKLEVFQTLCFQSKQSNHLNSGSRCKTEVNEVC